MNNYVVIGLGNFGFNVAKNLAVKGNNVLAIDSCSEQIDKIKDLVNDSVIGDVKNEQFLKEFIDNTIDAAIISTGENTFDSILAVHFLKKLGVQKIIVKAHDKTHGQILKVTGADEIIFPEKDIAEWWANRLSEPNLIEHLPLSEEYSIVEYACPDKFAGSTLKKLQLRSKYKILLIAVKDILNNDFILMPAADYVLKPDTVLILMGKKEDIGKMKVEVK
ncbi:MAG: TrkA family potassium uptake protein [Melioribacteraceae bacterium]|nr:TrkA family potassium uptake protein [Melioribacteraceae bacterium]MCF8396263.1 TrkA family potassium uptake protein [Melioribacteraceae bacterium]MCF8421172.1 TrkA family potassium uptake protein [Melioribacteraceae bacterium]